MGYAVVGLSLTAASRDGWQRNWDPALYQSVHVNRGRHPSSAYNRQCHPRGEPQDANHRLVQGLLVWGVNLPPNRRSLRTDWGILGRAAQRLVHVCICMYYERGRLHCFYKILLSKCTYRSVLENVCIQIDRTAAALYYY